MKKIFILALSVVATSLCAEIWMPAIFSDNMVLQSGAKNKLWGTAEANAKIEVKIGPRAFKTKADAKGNWSVFSSKLSVNAKPQVISVSEKSAEYASQIAEKFDDMGVRSEVDNSDERIGYKIRLAQMEKVPYMIILGENEANSGKVSIRKRNGEEIKDLAFEDAYKMIKEDIDSKRV